MEDVQPSQVAMRFGVFEVDLRAGELRKQGVRIKLQDQPFQILQILLERPGEVVTKKELQKRIWPADTFVDFDHGLHNAIKKLREALCDSAETPRFIETLPKRGYRFIAPVNGNGGGALVRSLDAPLVASAVSVGLARPQANKTELRLTQPANRKWRVGLLTIGIVVFVCGLLLVFNIAGIRDRLFDKKNSPAIHSLAVLPLQNLSGDPSQDYFADAMTEELITELSRLSSLRVISRTSIIRYRGTDKPLPQIARELNVDGIVEGTVQRAGDRVRITAQLIYGPADRHLWANSFERDVQNVLALQSTVASEIANEIQVKVTPAEQVKLKNVHPVNPEALSAYVEARFHLDQARKLEFYKDKQEALKEELHKAVSYLDRSIQKDPKYIPPYVAYFDAVHAGGISRLEFLPKAKAALMKALELDETNVAAHLALAGLLMQCEYDWAGAEREYKTATVLNPNSGDALFEYSEFLANIGQKAESDKQHELAQALDPARDYSALNAAERLGNTLEQNRQALEEKAPNDPFALATVAIEYAEAGRYKESVELWERCLGLYGWQDFTNVLKRADAAGGPKFALEEWMRATEEYSKQHDDVPVFVPVSIYTSLGNKDRAFAWLDKAYAQRNWIIIYLKSWSSWEPLRSDPRFNALLRRVGLPQ